MVLVGVAALSSCGERVQLDETLLPGDCTGPPGEGVDYFEVEGLSCDEQHELEVFAVVTLDRDDPQFPGHDEAFRMYEILCRQEFEEYVGISWSASRYGIYTVYPGRESWEDGYMAGTCLLGWFTASGTILRTTGSAMSTRQ